VLLGGILVGAGTLSVAGSTAAVAQSVNSIEVQGNRRVEAGTIRDNVKNGPHGRLGPAEFDE
jgi:outer membrane protein insertion porin family